MMRNYADHWKPRRSKLRFAGNSRYGDTDRPGIVRLRKAGLEIQIRSSYEDRI